MSLPLSTSVAVPTSNTTMVSFAQAWGLYLSCLAGLGIAACLIFLALLIRFILNHKHYPNHGIVPIQCSLICGMVVFLYLIFIVDDANYFISTPLFGIASTWVTTCLVCHSYYLVAAPSVRNGGLYSFFFMFLVGGVIQLIFGIETVYLRTTVTGHELVYFALFSMSLTITLLIFGIIAACVTPYRTDDEYTGNGVGATILTIFALWVVFFALCLSGVFFDNWVQVYKMLIIFTSYIIFMCYSVTETFTILNWLEKQKDANSLTVKKVVEEVFKVDMPFTKPPIGNLMLPPPYDDHAPLLPA
ncbi:membrane protein EE26 [Proboscivirus elephantidbeta5]|uniref:Membrane protein EE26 n=1 Tax=Elephant endotheliotropic herpesvirus 5 TaxID=768738 RepID=A0A075CYL3_9BETA|nr:membrane protein EE26 [Elephant endotheliotropic herpesvirus 5]AHC02792.1 membrane protein EE26 [Elephant endotheliotropic herpesvirus 5]